MAQPIVEPLTLWLAATNAWVVAPNGPGGECVLIDAPPEPGPILERLAALELRLVALLLDPGHIDHVGGISSVEHAQDHPVPVHIPDHDKHMLLDPAGTGGMMGRYLEGLDLRPPEIIEGLDDGTVVKGAGMSFEVLHTPGHTQGSVCLLARIGDDGLILFSGDHLFAGSIGRTDLPGGSFDQLMDSMERKILPLDDEIPVLPGHGPSTSVGRERMINPFLVELQQGGFPLTDAVILLHGFPEQPSTVDEIAPVLRERGYRVLTPRQRGYDPANRPTGRAAYRTSELAGDVLRLADREGIDRFHLVGHDWGAILAWWLAAREPQRLATMTSLTVPHPKAMREVVLRSKQLLQSYYVALFQLPWLPERVMLVRDAAALRRALRQSGLPEPHVDSFVREMQEPGALTAAINWYRGASARELTALPDVTDVPVLYVWGSRDLALSRAAAEATARHVTSPYRFVALEGASHWLPQAHADAVLRPLLEHLS